MYGGKAPSKTHVPSLTRRQAQIASMIRDGKENKEIAQEIGKSVKTVECHVSSAMSALGATNRMELVNLAIRYKLITCNCPCCDFHRAKGLEIAA
jgi:DNA-binding NarL/FixJ family response regulator